MNIIEGKLTDTQGMKIGIVAARFNEFIVSKLIEGARDALIRHDVKEENIDLAWVPGSFEIPLACKHLAESGRYDAIIALQKRNVDAYMQRGAEYLYLKDVDSACTDFDKALSLKKKDYTLYICIGIAVIISITAIVTIILINKKKKTLIQN
jgi:hypothetical protein